MERKQSLFDRWGHLNSDDPKMIKVILSLQERFGCIEPDPDLSNDQELARIKEVNKEVDNKAKALGYVLQKAYDKSLTYSQLIRNVINVAILIEYNETFVPDQILTDEKVESERRLRKGE